MIKKYFVLVLFFFLTIGQAQSPEKFTYQSIIKNSSGYLLKNQDVGLRISVLRNSTNGIAVYSEEHFPTSNSNGLVTLIIGEGLTGDNFSEINWGDGEFFLKVEVDPDGGVNYTMNQTSQLLSVPYALYAENAKLNLLGQDFITLQDQTLTVNKVDLADDIEGILPLVNGGTGSSSSPMIGVITAADEVAARSVLGLGTAATTASTDYATAAQGLLADSAQQPPVEGAFVDGDKTKLDGIEALADVTDTANVSAAGALMESELTNLAQVKAFDSSEYATAAQGLLADSSLQDASVFATAAQGLLADSAQQPPIEGAFVDGDKTKLDGIEALADVTDTANVSAAGALMESEVTNLAQVKAFDSSEYATALQGTKADSAQQPPVEGAFVDGDKTKLDGIEALADVTDTANVSAAGALMESEVTNLAQVKAFDSSAYATALQGLLADSAQQPPIEGAFVDGDKTKLDGIEALADVTNTANVTAAGALMESEVTNLAQVKAFDSSAYATALQGTKADSAQQPPIEGAFVDGDKTKLDGIEALADVTNTANVTAAGALMESEVTNLAQVKAFDSSAYATALQGTKADSAQQPLIEGAFVDGDKTKLDGIEALADVTNTANVTAAGALMESEVTNLAQVKAFDSSAYATVAQGILADSALSASSVSAFGATLIDDADSSEAKNTLGLAAVASSGDYSDLTNVPSTAGAAIYNNAGSPALDTGITSSEVNLLLGLGSTDNVTFNNVTANLMGNVTGQADTVGSLTGLTTDDLTEGSTNLYYTDVRADARITNALIDEDNMVSDSDTKLPSQQSVKAYVTSQVETKDALSELSGNTDDVAEGSTNLYYTDVRADARITNALIDEDNMVSDSDTKLPSQQSVKAYVTSQVETKDALSELSGNTDDVAEGSTNLYYTDVRADARITNALIDEDNMVSDSDTKLPSQQSVKAYVTSQVETKDALSELSGNTDDVAEGSTNLYYTDVRADARITNALIDEDNMVSDSDTKLPSQQSVKAYVTSQVETKDALSELSGNTDDVAEGSTNLYYTDVRADARITNALIDEDNMVSDSDTKLPSQQSVKAYVTSQVETKDALSELSGNTDDVAEGSTNLYYTDVRADARITNALIDEDNMVSDSDTKLPSQQSVKAYVTSQVETKDALSELSGNTDDVAEGSTNLYYTDVRADARITNALIDEDNMVSDSDTKLPSQQSVKAYVTSQVETKDALSELSGNTDDVAEGSTNLYYTDVRADARITNALIDEDNMVSDSDTKLPSQQSVKAYVTSQVETKDALSELSGNTDDVAEGSTNLYYTDVRADARITNALIDEDNMVSDSDTKLPSQQSVKAYVTSQVETKDALSELSGNTDDVAEGSTNLYYTDVRADARITNALIDEDNMVSDSDTKLPSQQSVKAYVDAAIPIGGIIMWSGTLVSIPSNWQLCDGSNSTPDLRDRFIVGAGNNYAVDASAGSNSNNVTTISVDNDAFSSTTTVVNGVNTDNRPPYYALAFIMRIQ